MEGFIKVSIAFLKKDFERLPDGMTRVNCGYMIPLTLKYEIHGNKFLLESTWDNGPLYYRVGVISLLLEELGYPKEITYDHEETYGEQEVFKFDKPILRWRIWVHINVPYCCIEEGEHGRVWIKKKIIP